MSRDPQGRPPRGRTLAVLLVAVLASSGGDLLLSYGMKQVGDVAGLGWPEVGAAARAAVATPSLLAGVACMALFFALYLVALSWADLSFVLPITAFSFIIVTLFAHLVLGEQVSPVRWVGVLCIVAGVTCISRT